MQYRVLAALAVLALSAGPSAGRAQSAAQDARIAQLVGYGLVVGLHDTGDTLTASPFTEQTLKSFLYRSGESASDISAYDGRVAMVVVTANFPLNAEAGQTLDINVAAMADATSLTDGSLVATSMMGPDGEVYAIAQGVLPPAPDPAKPTLTHLAGGALVTHGLH